MISPTKVTLLGQKGNEAAERHGIASGVPER